MKVLFEGQPADAVRFDQAAVYARIGCIGMDLDTGVSFRSPSDAYVLTVDGRRNVADGDWIITRADNSTLVLVPEAFDVCCTRADDGAPR